LANLSEEVDTMAAHKQASAGKGGRKKKTATAMTLPMMRPNAAGVDIGAEEIWVAVPGDRDEQPVRRFRSFTGDLKAIVAWLRECHIDTVVMESTGVYWIPLFQMLADGGFEVYLVNARQYKNVAGRPTDAGDCQWLQYLHSVGLVKGSFRPAQAICAVRSLLRHRESLIQAMSKMVQHLQKSLDQMNLKIHYVLSDVMGVSGLAILDAIVAGERDPEVLAKLRNKMVRASEPEVIQALEGDYRPEHVIILAQCLRRFRADQQELEILDREMEQFMMELPVREPAAGVTAPDRPSKRQRRAPAFDLRQQCFRMAGVDLTEVPGIEAQTAHVLLTEIGPDLTAFPNASAFCSWLGLCPHNEISGGKILASRTRRCKHRAALALRLGAQALHRSQTPLGHYLRKMKSKLGPPAAITATAHKMARILYHMLTTKEPYREQASEAQQQRQQQRTLARIKTAARAAGYQLVPMEPMPANEELVH
jgi:transposase